MLPRKRSFFTFSDDIYASLKTMSTMSDPYKGVGQEHPDIIVLILLGTVSHSLLMGLATFSSVRIIVDFNPNMPTESCLYSLLFSKS